LLFSNDLLQTINALTLNLMTMKTIFTLILIAIAEIVHAQCFTIEDRVFFACDTFYCGPYTFSKGIYRIPYETLTNAEVYANHISNSCIPGQISFTAGNLNHYDDHYVVAAADGWVKNTTSNGETGGEIIWMKHPNGEWTMYAGINSGVFGPDELIPAGTIIGTEHNYETYPYYLYDLEFAVLTPVDTNELVFIELPDFSHILDYNFAERRVPLFCDITGHIAETSTIYPALGCSESCSTVLPFVSTTFEAGDFNAFIDDESLTTDADFTLEPASSVVIQSSSSVTLKPGFHAEYYSTFQARTGDCSGADNRSMESGKAITETVNTFSVNPNPASQIATLHWFMNEDARVKISVCDMGKRTLMQIVNSEQMNAGSHDQGIDISSLTPGMYLVIFELNGEREIQKLAVQR
jgi:hypothetical protein